LIAPWTW